MPTLLPGTVNRILSVLFLLLGAGNNLCASASLQNLKFTGILAIDRKVQVCLLDPQSGRAVWLTVGEPADGLWAESFDPTGESVVVRAGEARRKVFLREAKVASLPVAYLPDGTVDWFHMQLSEKEKEKEANLLMWDILEVGRLARLGKLPPGEGRGSR
ncbi:MAG TPA: hypothetical protein VGA56_15900 [Opitutaceae bacterium]